MVKSKIKNAPVAMICCICLVVLMIITIIVLIILKNNKNEKFKNVPWAFEQGPEYQPYSTNPCSKKQQIVGANSAKDEIYGWQYGDKNTLVDYHFYKENNDLSFYEESDIKNTSDEAINSMKKMDRIAPITTSDIGIIPNAQYEVNGFV
jgi:hypothetical protein